MDIIFNLDEILTKFSYNIFKELIIKDLQEEIRPFKFGNSRIKTMY